MKPTEARKVTAILLNDSVREAGSGEFNGREASWGRAYQLTTLEYGNKRGEVRKYSVIEEKEREVTSQLSLVGWGALLELELDESNHVSSVNVLLDWSDDIPLT